MDVDAERLLEYLEPFIVPLRSDTFRFSRPWLRDVFQHINDPRRPNYAVGMRLNLPAEYLLIHRVWLGGIGVLCQIGGEVHGRELVAAYLPGVDLPPLGRPGGVARHHQSESSLPSMLRRYWRLQTSQVQTSRPFSMPRAHVSRASPSAGAVRPHVAQTSCSGVSGISGRWPPSAPS